MNAITLWQPHASLIAAGMKKIETRTHNRFRRLAGSRIAIHAASRQPTSHERRAIWNGLCELGIDTGDNHVIWQWLTTPPLVQPPLGCLVATVYVIRAAVLNNRDHAKAACCEIGRNRFGLFLEDVRKLDPTIPFKGARGIWTVPDDVIPEYAR